MDKLIIGDMTFVWLNGGVTAIDGGAMFGVVPKTLWGKRYPSNENNQIELATDPILLQYDGHNILIDVGLGKGKLSDKQKRNFGVLCESEIEESLKKINLTTDDIDTILLTHMHFDHVGGLTIIDENGELASRFPNAKIYVTEVEWDEIREPNLRTRNTYLAENWKPVMKQVITFSHEIEVFKGITMKHTGGHSNGHAIIVIKHNGEQIVHMGDIMPTHAHQHPLWVLAFDDYPMDSIKAKLSILEYAYQENTKFIFYHDAIYRMVQWDKEGKNIVNHLKRTEATFIPWDNIQAR